MALRYHAQSFAPVRVVYQRAVWWNTGKIAWSFRDNEPNGGVQVALYERDAELSARSAWFDYDGNHVIDA